ncbi:MAG: transport protein TonB [Bacteroidetes bacterium]|jgi:protein TonB|nr:transport protein TonB [Bacteroidota bacterium]
MKSIFLVLLLLTFIKATAQKSNVPAEDTTIYTVVDTMPGFPGGTKALMEYMRNNIIYTGQDEVCGCSKIRLQFIVNKQGKVIQPKAFAHPYGECASLDNFLRSIEKKLVEMPDWTPGKSDGKPVNVRYNLPMYIKFQ